MLSCFKYLVLFLNENGYFENPKKRLNYYFWRAATKRYPFCQYVNLTHLDTFIHRPFNFATFRGSKSRDRVSGNDWAVLRSRTSMFHDSVPSLEVTTYSVHINAGTHTTFTSGPPFGGISPHTAFERDFQQLYP